MSILYLMFLAILFVMGLTLLPAMSFFIRDSVPKSLAEFLVFGHMCLVHLAWGGSALIQRGWGYDLVPLRVAGDDVLVLLEDGWTKVRASVADVEGYAFGSFLLLCERGEHLKVFEAEDVPRADGGETWDGTLNETRQGFRAFDASEAPENTVSKANGPKIDLGKVAEMLRAGNSEALAASGRNKALLEHGSMWSKGGWLYTVAGAIVCLILGIGTIWLAGMV